MYCPRCGSKNPDDARYCIACGDRIPVVPAPMEQAPPDQQQPAADAPLDVQPVEDRRAPVQPVPAARVQDYMVHSIVVTVFSFCCCCFINPVSPILGITAIIYASSVHSKEAAGDVAGAESAANTARVLLFVSLGVMLLLWAGVFLMKIFTGGVDFFSNYFGQRLHSI
jgi:hypothetical protein